MWDAFAWNNPDGRLTWGFTLNALKDKRANYNDIRKYVKDCQEKYGDEVSYFLDYFHAMYLPRERVNREISQALQIINGYNKDTDNLTVNCKPNALVLFNPVIDNRPGWTCNKKVDN